MKTSNNLARMFSPGIIRKPHDKVDLRDVLQIQIALEKETFFVGLFLFCLIIWLFAIGSLTIFLFPELEKTYIFHFKYPDFPSQQNT